MYHHYSYFIIKTCIFNNFPKTLLLINYFNILLFLCIFIFNNINKYLMCLYTYIINELINNALLLMYVFIELIIFIMVLFVYFIMMLILIIITTIIISIVF